MNKNTEPSLNRIDMSQAREATFEIMANVGRSAHNNQPFAFVLVGAYVDPAQPDRLAVSQHVQGDSNSIAKAIRALVAGAVGNYASSPRELAHLRDVVSTALSAGNTPPVAPVESVKTSNERINKMLADIQPHLDAEDESCRIVLTGKRNDDGSVHSIQNCIGDPGIMAAVILDLIDEFSKNCKDVPELQNEFLRLLREKVS